MELFFELLLTAAATLLVAFLLAKLFSSANNNDLRHGRAVGPADVIAEEKVEEEEAERIIEVDEVKAKGTWADAAAPTLSEGWVEVEKPLAAVAAEGKTAWVAEEEGVPATLATELFLGTVLEERKEEGEVGKKQRDLTAAAAATEAAGEAKLRDLGAETTASREILGLELEKEPVQHHDLAAELAPSEVLDAELQKQEVQPTEPVVVEQRHLVAEPAPAQVTDAGREEEEGAQAVEVIPHELASVAAEVPEVVLQKQQQEEEQVVEVSQHELSAEVAPREFPHQVATEEEQLIELYQHELAAEVAPREFPHQVATEEEQLIQVYEHELAAQVAPTEFPHEVAMEQEQLIEVYEHELAAQVAPREFPDEVSREEELKQQSVEEVVDQHEEVQNKEKAQCEAGLVDQQEKLVPEEELVVKKADDLNINQEGSSNDEVSVQLPEKEATLLGMPEDEAKASMEFEEWEGIERSEVEKRFGAAAAFAASDAGAAALSKLDSDVQLQLQGLLKVAIDGPCYDSTQPLTLRPSSRAKWVSWQKLGNMHPEIAMEKYMDLLSECIPRWMGDKTSSTKKHEGDVDSEGAALAMTAPTSDPQTNQGNEGSISIDEGPLTSPPNPDKGQSSDIPAE